MSNLLKARGLIRIWLRTNKNGESQFFQIDFPVIWKKNLKISPNHSGIIDLRNLREISTNIQKSDRTLRSL